jgi:hypothetical protein
MPPLLVSSLRRPRSGSLSPLQISKHWYIEWAIKVEHTLLHSCETRWQWCYSVLRIKARRLKPAITSRTLSRCGHCYRSGQTFCSIRSRYFHARIQRTFCRFIICLRLAFVLSHICLMILLKGSQSVPYCAAWMDNSFRYPYKQSQTVVYLCSTKAALPSPPLQDSSLTACRLYSINFSPMKLVDFSIDLIFPEATALGLTQPLTEMSARIIPG